MLKPVGVKITSAQYSANEELYQIFFNPDREPPEDLEPLLAALEKPVTSQLDPKWIRPEPEEDDEDVMEIFTTGRLHASDGLVRLSYTEHDEDGEGEVKTVLSFAEAEPQNVVMSRTGDINTTFIFEVGKRTKCVYNLNFGCIELTVFTLSVDNRLLADGTLTLNYFIEIRGASAEHRCVTVKLSERSELSVPRE